MQSVLVQTSLFLEELHIFWWKKLQCRPLRQPPTPKPNCLYRLHVLGWVNLQFFPEIPCLQLLLRVKKRQRFVDFSISVGVLSFMGASSVIVSLLAVSSTSSLSVAGVTGWEGGLVGVLVGVGEGVVGETDFGRDFPFLKQSSPNFSASLMESTQLLHTKNVTLVKEGRFLSSFVQQELHIFRSHFKHVTES